MSSESKVLCDLRAYIERMGLAHVTANPQSNIFSPLSALLSIGPLVFYSEGDVRDKFLDMLGVERSTGDADLADALRFLGAEFKKNKGTRFYWQFAIHPGAKLPDRVVEYVKQRMGVPILVTSFPEPGVSTINKAVAKATNGMIQQALCSADPESLVLVNAIYLNRRWSIEMERIGSDDWLLPESSYRVNYVMAKGHYKYASSGGYHFVELEYIGGSVMEIYLTTSRKELPTSLTVDKMSMLRSSAEYKPLKLSIPRWQSESSMELQGQLAKAGVDLQLSGVNELVIQQTAKVSVTERGTEAAAVTAVWQAKGLVRYKPKFVPFKVDRPFIYTIRTGPVTEFVGYVYDVTDSDPVEDKGMCQVA